MCCDLLSANSGKMKENKRITKRFLEIRSSMKPEENQPSEMGKLNEFLLLTLKFSHLYAESKEMLSVKYTEHRNILNRGIMTQQTS